ncbi:MAG TPA: VOC family protein, partial [Lentisphaeria bacterium]|nr:VOC family protein [Lentisphaeria bacterium]
MIQNRFDHVGLNVQDLDATIAFLKAMFDFDVIQRWDHPKQAFVGKGTVVLGVMEQKDYDFAVHTMAHIAFPCAKADFARVVARVKELAAPIVSGPKVQRDGETILFR